MIAELVNAWGERHQRHQPRPTAEEIALTARAAIEHGWGVTK